MDTPEQVQEWNELYDLAVSSGYDILHRQIPVHHIFKYACASLPFGWLKGLAYDHADLWALLKGEHNHVL